LLVCLSSAVTATRSGSLTLFGEFDGPWTARLAKPCGFLWGAPTSLVRDVAATTKSKNVADGARHAQRQVLVWSVPITLGHVFLVLFGSANTIIERELMVSYVGAPVARLGARWSAHLRCDRRPPFARHCSAMLRMDVQR